MWLLYYYHQEMGGLGGQASTISPAAIDLPSTTGWKVEKKSSHRAKAEQGMMMVIAAAGADSARRSC